jgi:SPP1 gp7 family putative phage head morphogenesis protein
MIRLQLAIRQTHKPDRFTKRKNRTLKPIRPSRVAEAAYRSDLLSVVNRLTSTVNNELIPVIDNSPFLGETVDHIVRDAISDSEIRRKIKELVRRFELDPDSATRSSRRMVNSVKRTVDDRLRSEVRRSVGIDVEPFLRNDNQLTPLIDQAVKDNVALIKSIPEQYFQKLEEHIVGAVVSGARHEKLKEVVGYVGKIAENRAKLIARDQVSKLNGSINRIRQSSVGIDEYVWSTSKDERVRETHAENEGKKFRWDNPPEETGHPGEDINCRCVAIPYFNLDAMEAEMGL